MNALDDWNHLREKIEFLCVRIAELCSVWIGDSKCGVSYSAGIFDLKLFRLLAEDVAGSESDAHGYSKFTTWHIKVFDDTRLLVHAHRKIDGWDEHDGEGYGDSRVGFISDSWHIVAAAYRDRDICRDLYSIIDCLEREIGQKNSTKSA